MLQFLCCSGTDLPCPPPMGTRQVVLLTPPRSSHLRPLLSRQHSAPISPLAATLMNLLASVANKELTGSLSPLAATLTKNGGVGRVMVNQLSSRFDGRKVHVQIPCFLFAAHSSKFRIARPN